MRPMTHNIIAVLALVLILFSAPQTRAETPTDLTIVPESLDALAQAVGIEASENEGRKVKIAIFDNGFLGLKAARGVTVPRSTVLRKMPLPLDPKVPETVHGLKMAEILTNLADRADLRYELHLFTVNGYTNFAAAISTVIKEKFDLVSFSEVWEYGGNDDGRGFFNQLVSKATASGVTWVNAAGNFGKSTFRQPVEKMADDWAFAAGPGGQPNPNNAIQIRCHKNEGGVCHLRLVLAWNSFSDDVNVGTDKDLDLVLSDDTLKIIATSGLIQKKSIQPNDKDASLYPREIIHATVKPGIYYARVKIRSSNFSKAHDEFRVTSSGAFTEMLNPTHGDSMLNPADNPSVITVGASDASLTSFSRRLQRPDVSAVSTVKTVGGTVFEGSSNAGAAYAARIAVELSRRGPLSREAILQILRGGTVRPNPRSNSPRTSGSDIRPTGNSCYVFQTTTLVARHVRAMLRQGGVVVETTAGIKVFIDEDPFDRARRLGYQIADQHIVGFPIFVADASGFYAASPSQRAQLGSDTLEFVRTPPDARFCSLR